MSDPVSANFAITAYRSAGGPGAAEAGGDPLSDFGAALRQAMDGAVELSHRADAASAQALGVQKVLALDTRRRLVLLRVDGREVLLLTGGPQDSVLGWLP